MILVIQDNPEILRKKKNNMGLLYPTTNNTISISEVFNLIFLVETNYI